MSLYALRARSVLPMKAVPQDGGVVTIDSTSGRILDVGRRPARGADVIDLGDVTLLPGLVNAHTHLEFSSLAKPLGKPGNPLPDWIRDVLSQRSRGDEVATSLAAGLSESLSNGVTMVGDIATCEWADYQQDARSPDLTVYHEVIGFSGMRAKSARAAAVRMVNQLDSITAATAPGRNSITYGLSPHAPYTVHPELVAELAQLAAQRNLPVAMHLAESTEELQLLDSGDGPFRDLLEQRSMWDAASIPPQSHPIDYLRILAQAPRALIIHGNYLDDRSLEFLASHRDRMTLVYCPRTHHYFRHTPYPLGRALAAGVHIAIGTDSRASSANLSVLDELRAAYRWHPRVSPQQFLEMATVAGAEALGYAKSAGSLRPGLVANLTAIPCDANTSDPYEAVLTSSAAPCATWLRGRQLAQDPLA